MSDLPNILPKNTALLLIDLISDFEFEDGEKLFERTLPAARRIARLKERASAAHLPVIYVNDNFGKWQEDFKAMADRILEGDSRGKKVAELLRPSPTDYYVLKPHRSAFYSTALEPLLRNLNVQNLILTGVTADICIMFTANDAYMRDLDLHIPSDCVAAVKTEFHDQAMVFIERVLKADTRPSTELEFDLN